MEKLKNMNEKLIDAFSSSRCPICLMLREKEFNELCNWVVQSGDEHKNSSNRIELLFSGGFCNNHFWEFQKLSTYYGSASISAQLIERILKIFERYNYQYFHDFLRQRNGDANIWSIEENSYCPVCREMKRNGEEYLKELTRILENEEFQKKYLKGCGLCIPHWLKCMYYVENESIAKFLMETQITQLKKIKENAISFIHKKKPPLRWQQTEDEKCSWFKAIEKIVGRIGA